MITFFRKRKTVEEYKREVLLKSAREQFRKIQRLGIGFPVLARF